ncbi:MAG: hypothetical protein MSA61_04680 [Coriobacteriaceae bacterium]|uniref:hypothetical protein n=1 Tax=Tractidigestivibacter sp. TaxID=2847320 RepID=UPI002A8DF8CB|nr:hypothetical protein [Tractidigestivibacter sp.]MCI7438507.1 hypothetical protein [Coriobacteriaceae bacterium]MDD7585156.1 hypothetical protein [Coriobacteriaceae bacterium]MDY4535274.1 hypothetical protein [Tractidigestivibacter sp.]MDY5272494.1 hypothetical protein [Tractidigestivibacter sp.]
MEQIALQGKGAGTFVFSGLSGRSTAAVRTTLSTSQSEASHPSSAGFAREWEH